MELNPGTRVRDYQIIRQLGSGGMGEVWLAHETMLDREVAIKLLNHQLTQDAEFAVRFRNEARIQARLTHPNIVGLLSFFEEGGDFYMVLGYAPGITLREIINRTGPIPEQRTLRIFNQIAAALEYAHSKGIIHRDVKPSNVMVDPDNNDHVLMMDFGIARLLTDGHLTRTGTRLGTMHYMSPEQVLATKEIDQRSDIYSAGVVLYEMLSGRLPFNADTDSEYIIQHKIVTEEMPDPREVYPHISEQTIGLLRSITVKDLNARPLGFGVPAGASVIPISFNNSIPTTRISDPPPVGQTVPAELKNGMVLVEGGTFLMGSNDGADNEKPVHEVKVSSFWLSIYQITQAEWRKVIDSNPSYFKGDDLPVDTVSWFDAVEYCNRRSLKEGLKACYSIMKRGLFRQVEVSCDWSANGYRLPTEAEWEFAARGGTQSKGYVYAGSNDLKSVGWYRDNSGNKTHPVGTKAPSELGLYDLSGNVWEWCWDWGGYNKKIQGSDPKGADSGSNRVLRGGSWYFNDFLCRVAYRSNSGPGGRGSSVGFRVARAVF